KGYENVLIIGSDCYDLTLPIVVHAFQCLENNDVVLGPAVDGGYYLLGMKKKQDSLFAISQWSTDTVLADTIAASHSAGVSYALLNVLNDVDEERDVNFDY
ncbi:MAG: DUF2064 domain-containing protein, partial [Gloeobacteraceae cyanobacterium ES-bin-316]|nr:DUF2064 domain-containing protein [Ferruginibacter sp.]